MQQVLEKLVIESLLGWLFAKMPIRCLVQFGGFQALPLPFHEPNVCEQTCADLSCTFISPRTSMPASALWMAFELLHEVHLRPLTIDGIASPCTCPQNVRSKFCLSSSDITYCYLYTSTAQAFLYQNATHLPHRAG